MAQRGSRSHEGRLWNGEPHRHRAGRPLVWLAAGASASGHRREGSEWPGRLSSAVWVLKLFLGRRAEGSSS